MAIIGEIRKRQWLLLIVIFGALLAFVLSEAIRGGGSSVEEKPISNVFGETLTSSEYQQLLEQEYAKYERAYGQALTNEDKARIEENFFNIYLNNRMYQTQYDAIGLKVTKEEYNDILQGSHINPTVYEQNGLFVDQSGTFQIDSLRRQLPIILQNNPSFQYYLDDIIGDQAEKQRLRTKYNNLITKGLYVTSQEAKKNYLAQNSTATFNFVYQPYSAIPDSAVKVTDSDIRAYYDEHKNEKQYEGRNAISFQYVAFNIEPSEDDKAQAKSYLDSNFINRFKEAENDSAFVFTNSDSKNLDFSFKKSSDFPLELDSMLQNADTGDVFGPYLEDNYYKVSKVRDIETQEEAKVRHILIGYDDPQRQTFRYGTDPAEIQRIADSVTNVIKTQNNFDDMVSYSTDISSVPNGGVYEWFDKSVGFVQPFKDAAFNNPVNSVRQVKTDFGIHIMEVLGRRQGKKLSVATVDVEVRPSKATTDKAIDKAADFRNLFSTQNMDDTAFINKARKEDLFVENSSNVLLNQESINGFDNNVSEIKDWGFNSEIGDLSDFMVIGNEKVVIAHLLNKTNEGTPSFASVKKAMSFEVIKEKKAELYKGKMQGKSIDEIAASINATVQNASNIAFSQNSVPGGGNEPKMVGLAFATPVNTVSKPTAGKNGVFVVSPTAVVNATVPEGYAFTTEQNSAMGTLRSSAENRVYQALVEVSNLKDKRAEVRIIKD